MSTGTPKELAEVKQSLAMFRFFSMEPLFCSGRFGCLGPWSRLIRFDASQPSEPAHCESPQQPGVWSKQMIRGGHKQGGISDKAHKDPGRKRKKLSTLHRNQMYPIVRFVLR